MATKTDTAQEGRGLHITEGVSSVWHYHLSEAGTNIRALCGKQTMNTAIPLKTWGMKSHMPGGYCLECERAGRAELQAVNAILRDASA